MGYIKTVQIYVVPVFGRYIWDVQNGHVWTPTTTYSMFMLNRVEQSPVKEYRISFFISMFQVKNSRKRQKYALCYVKF